MEGSEFEYVQMKTASHKEIKVPNRNAVLCSALKKGKPQIGGMKKNQHSQGG